MYSIYTYLFYAGSRFKLRWFTPNNEVNLCGHATLASSHVLFNVYKNVNAVIEFETLSGVLKARKDGEKIIIDLPLADVSSEVSLDKLSETSIIV